MISYLDEQVGDMVAKLKNLGLYENTLIIFSSDNGPTYSGGADTPFFESAKPFKSERGWAKGYLHEGGIRVPMIASWPGHIEPNSKSDHLSAFYDMMPTMCDIIGLPIPNQTDGISLLPTLLNNAQKKKHEYLYWEFPAYNGQQAVRLGKWKGIRKDIFDGNLNIDLYDLDNDIQEQNNLAAQYPEVMEKIEAIMKQEHIPSSLDKFKFAQLGDK
jgi:arylsulfatase